MELDHAARPSRLWGRDGAGIRGGCGLRLDLLVALLRLQNGEVDVPGDGIPPAKFQEVMGDPAQAARVVQGGQLQTGYITLNVTMAPFDKLEVRKAVNMAIRNNEIQLRRTGLCERLTGRRIEPIPA